MASISTCFTVTPKPNSIIFASKPSLAFKFSQFLSFRSQNPFPFKNTTKVRYSRGFVPLIRASIDVTAPDIKPGGIIESDKLPSDVRKRTMDAVDSCGGRVTIGDVASKAGLKLNQAQKALQALAADTNGFLEVFIVPISDFVIWKNKNCVDMALNLLCNWNSHRYELS